MAFITLRRSRNTRSYYLVESYRDDQGRSRKRTLCYLGREQDGTDTPEKALAHWQRIRQEATRDLASAQGDRRRVLRGRIVETDERIGRLRRHIDEAARVKAERQQRRQAAEETRRRLAEEAVHWHAIEQLRLHPTADNAQAAKRAFRILALRLHPDQGGSHEGFIQLQQVYERAAEGWRRLAA
jgi:hypothetical protein